MQLQSLQNSLCSRVFTEGFRDYLLALFETVKVHCNFKIAENNRKTLEFLICLAKILDTFRVFIT